MGIEVLELDYRFAGKFRPPADGATAPGPFTKKVTAAGGSPTVQSNGGLMELALDNTNEAQNLCLYWGDELGLAIDQLISMDIWAKATASLDASVTMSMGLASARNDAIASIAAKCLFQLAGSNVLKALAGDGTNSLAATTTGFNLSTTIRRMQMDFGSGVLTQAPPGLSKGGKAQILLAAENGNGQLRPVLRNSQVRLDAYSSGLQPFFQVQKTAGTATGTLSIERVLIKYRQGS